VNDEHTHPLMNGIETRPTHRQSGVTRAGPERVGDGVSVTLAADGSARGVVVFMA